MWLPSVSEHSLSHVIDHNKENNICALYSLSKVFLKAAGRESEPLPLTSFDNDSQLSVYIPALMQKDELYVCIYAYFGKKKKIVEFN